MIAQRTNTHVLAPFSARANASVRLVSSFHLFLARSHFGGDRQLSSQVNLNAARSLHDHHHGNVWSAPCLRSNPHRRPSLLHPTL